MFGLHICSKRLSLLLCRRLWASHPSNHPPVITFGRGKGGGHMRMRACLLTARLGWARGSGLKEPSATLYESPRPALYVGVHRTARSGWEPYAHIPNSWLMLLRTIAALNSHRPGLMSLVEP